MIVYGDRGLVFFGFPVSINSLSFHRFLPKVALSAGAVGYGLLNEVRHFRRNLGEADIARGLPGAAAWDLAMSHARRALDWQKQIELFINPGKGFLCSQSGG